MSGPSAAILLDRVQKAVDLTLEQSLAGGTHWSRSSMAEHWALQHRTPAARNSG
ncbi:hypothetical protein [Nocardia alba]|uniref:hypothetical protein n=1 Tax=Nocardia alba TaxID=225051 RepID=UPI0012ED5384|nr:hypothetical protein [Nocardia alba]